MNQEPSTKQTKIHTDGGTYVEKDVQTGGGDFIGRDQIIQIVQSPSFYLATVAIVAIVAMYLSRPEGGSLVQPTPTPSATEILKFTPTATPLPTTTITLSPIPSSTPTVPSTATPQPTQLPESKTATPTPIAESAQVEVEFCTDEVQVSSELMRERFLLIEAKRQAVEQLADTQVESQTMIDRSNVLSDSVTAITSDLIRVVGTPRYYPGDGLDEYCVSIVAELVEPDGKE